MLPTVQGPSTETYYSLYWNPVQGQITHCTGPQYRPMSPTVLGPSTGPILLTVLGRGIGPCHPLYWAPVQSQITHCTGLLTVLGTSAGP